MTGRCGAAGRHPWAVVAVLAVAVALATTTHAAAPPPPTPVVPGPPLFDPGDIHTNPVHMAMTVLGGATTSRTGAWSAAATLFAGEHPRVNAWRLEGPLTNFHSRRAVGAGALALAGFQLAPGATPLSSLATIQAGAHLDCWTLIDTDRFRPLPRAWLNAITDSRGIGVGGPEAEIYSRVLARAYFTSVQAFRKAARHDITYAHIFNDPNTYRGNVIPIEGRLKRINRFRPTPEAAEAGVNDLYEAWVFIEQLGANPYCVVFTEWPEGLPRSLLGKDKIDDPVKVAFAGYFFKKFRYTANDARSTQRDAPLLIGRTLTVLDLGTRSGPPSIAWARSLMIAFVSVIAGLILGVVGLTVWFRRNDYRIQKRLLAARTPEFVLPPPDAAPVAPPVAAPVRARVVTTERLPNPPRITFPSATGDRGEPGSGEPGGKRDQGDPPPEEGAGA